MHVSKCSIMHRFSKSHGSSFRCRLGHKSGAKWRSRYVYAVPKCFIEVINRQRYTCIRLQHKKHVSLCSKCSIMHRFSRSHGSSFRCRFGHKSGPYGDPDMFMQCHKVSLRLSKDDINRFSVSNIKCMCPCAQNIRLCTIVRGRTDPHFGAVWS